MIRIIPDLSAEVVVIGDQKKTEENPNKSYGSAKYPKPTPRKNL